jgi:hypothetical protein
MDFVIIIIIILLKSTLKKGSLKGVDIELN